jgi:NitT/TauT family transport system ATP-binding protein
LLPWKTVRANIELGPKFTGDIEASSTVNHFLKMVGLQKYENHYPDQLSGGMQQRVGIARALATFPRVLLMDEPFAALDYQTRLMMQENLLSLWEEFGTTVVFVTHDVDEAIFLSDRILLMSASPGRIVKDIANPLPRPRTQMISSEAKFLEIKRDCMEIIRAEALSTF